MITLLNGNTLKIPLADGSVHMAMTSPPYWGLRNYFVEGQLGLERVPDCLGWATGAPFRNRLTGKRIVVEQGCFDNSVRLRKE